MKVHNFDTEGNPINLEEITLSEELTKRILMILSDNIKMD